MTTVLVLLVAILIISFWKKGIWTNVWNATTGETS